MRAPVREMENRGMAEVPLEISALIVEAADPERLAAFRSELLGRPITELRGSGRPFSSRGACCDCRVERGGSGLACAR